MLGTVKGLTAIIEKELQFVEEAKASREQHDEATYNAYMARMEAALQSRFARLTSISSNEKMISKYEKKIAEAFK